MNRKEKQLQYYTLRRLRWIAAGLCSNCGKLPSEANKRQCIDCNTRGRIRVKAKRAIPEEAEKIRKIARNGVRQRREEVIRYGGGKCIRCGFDDIRALQLDHVAGGGNKLRRDGYEHRSAGHTYNRMIKVKKMLDDKVLQILCANCNWIKRDENGELPCRPLA